MASAVKSAATLSSLALHRTVASMRAARQRLAPELRVGFVPTMGALHEGHLSLIREARRNSDVLVASIFVNPTQFGPSEDLDKYPRQLERDTQLLTEMGVDHLFAPERDAMYGQHHVTYVSCDGFDDLPEGRVRPGHFRGVATIVNKLFNIVQPTDAYFGQKDAAQCCLIRRMVQDLDMDIRVVVLDTIREADGLAMSSRNAYLTEAERQAAPVVYRSLCRARDLYLKSEGAVTARQLEQVVQQTLQTEPLVSCVQYVAVDSRETMQPIVGEVGTDGAIVSLACKVGSVRLIDNIVLTL